MKRAIIMMLVSVVCMFAGDGSVSDGNLWTYIIGLVLGAGIGISVITKVINWGLAFIKTKVGSEKYNQYVAKTAEASEVLTFILQDLKDGKIDNTEDIIEKVKALFDKSANPELNTDEIETHIQSLKKSSLGR